MTFRVVVRDHAAAQAQNVSPQPPSKRMADAVAVDEDPSQVDSSQNEVWGLCDIPCWDGGQWAHVAYPFPFCVDKVSFCLVQASLCAEY